MAKTKVEKPIAEPIIEQADMEQENNLQMNELVEELNIETVESIENTPVDIKEELKEVSDKEPEIIKEKAQEVKKSPKAMLGHAHGDNKKVGKVILVLKDGCIVETSTHGNIFLPGKKYTELKVGDAVEF